MSASPVTLVMANSDGESLDGAPAVQYFVDRVAELSSGAVQIRVENGWKGDNDEVTSLRDAASGEADLAWAGTRSLDRLGVTALTPLHAPFLIGSYNAQTAVIRDPLVQQQLSSLEPAGLTGLALLADELRMPVGISRPLRTPSDYRGAVFRTVPSDIQNEAVRALGAEPTDGTVSQTMDGAELMWWTYTVNRFFAFARFPTVNTPLWPRSVVIVANQATMAGLTEQARGWVQAAARDAVSWSLEHARDREQSEVDLACRAGAKLVRAAPAEIEALRDQVQPVWERLRTDPATAALFERVRQLAAASPPDPPLAVPAGCAFRPGDERLAPAVPRPLTTPGDPGALPTGVYRYELTPEFLRSAGLPEGDVYGNAGVITYTLGDGRWSYEQQPLHADVTRTTCEGYYTVEGSTFTASATTQQRAGECAPVLWTAQWDYDGRVLTWSGVTLPYEPGNTDYAPVFAGESGWRKIA